MFICIHAASAQLVIGANGGPTECAIVGRHADDGSDSGGQLERGYAYVSNLYVKILERARLDQTGHAD